MFRRLTTRPDFHPMHLHHLLLLLLFPLLCTVFCNDIGPYQVLRVSPLNESQLSFITELYDNAADYNLSFWKAPRRVGAAVDVMIPPNMNDSIEHFLNSSGLVYNITIHDVQKLIETREHLDTTTNKDDRNGLGSFFRRLHDVSRPFYNFRVYGSYSEMKHYMKALARDYPHICRLIIIGKTHEGRTIEGLRISSPVHSNRKRVIWVDGGIHAREWAAPHTALYFIKELVTKYGQQDSITHYVNSLMWIIVPCINPDGYEYTRSSSSPTVRLWRKNRSPEKCTTDRWSRQRCCMGVDLNRNFDFHWTETGSSPHPCSEVYHGSTAFSEPETRAVRDMLLSPQLHGRIDAFITMHTYSQIWIHPYGDRRVHYPDGVAELLRVGKKAAKALESMYGTRYVVGSGADTLYPAAGGSDDWAKETGGVEYVYLLELRPDERHTRGGILSEVEGFILDERELIPTARETWAGVKVVADSVLERNGIPRRTRGRSTGRWRISG